jgi:hypothetical protein
METLNKNWFAFTLVAVIFGLLGFLLGRQANSTKKCAQMSTSKCHSAGTAQMPHATMMKMMGEDGLFIIPEGHENIEDIDIKEETGKNGEKRIEVRLKGKKN